MNKNSSKLGTFIKGSLICHEVEGPVLCSTNLSGEKQIYMKFDIGLG